MKCSHGCPRMDWVELSPQALQNKNLAGCKEPLSGWCTELWKVRVLKQSKIPEEFRINVILNDSLCSWADVGEMGSPCAKGWAELKALSVPALRWQNCRQGAQKALLGCAGAEQGEIKAEMFCDTQWGCGDSGHHHHHGSEEEGGTRMSSGVFCRAEPLKHQS